MNRSRDSRPASPPPRSSCWAPRAPPGGRQQRHHHRVRGQGLRGHVGRGPRRHGRAGRGRAEGRRAQRHRAPAGLGQLRRHHQGVRRQVRHQGQLRAQPDAAVQDEINAANRLKGQSTAPDVFDLGQPWPWPTRPCSRPTRWPRSPTCPTRSRTPNGAWVNDYGGYMSIGYDSVKVPDITSVADLLKPAFKGKVALNGDPTQAGAAFAGVHDGLHRATAARRRHRQGRRLLQASSRTPATSSRSTRRRRRSSPARPRSSSTGTTSTPPPRRSCRRGRSSCPRSAVVAGYYFQAINKDAPHPAAARLWQEFLYSDEGQNLWLKGGARPVRADAMAEAGTLDPAPLRALPKVTGPRWSLPTADAEGRQGYLADHWSQVISGGCHCRDEAGAGGGRQVRRRRGRPRGRLGDWLPSSPFFVFVAVFLHGPDPRRRRRRVPGRTAGSPWATCAR